MLTSRWTALWRYSYLRG